MYWQGLQLRQGRDWLHIKTNDAAYLRGNADTRFRVTLARLPWGGSGRGARGTWRRLLGRPDLAEAWQSRLGRRARPRPSRDGGERRPAGRIPYAEERV